MVGEKKHAVIGAIIGIALATLCIFLAGCSTGSKPEVKLGPGYESDKLEPITLWTHDISLGLEETVRRAARKFQREVFNDAAKCPSVGVVRTNDPTRPGIHVYDSKTHAPGLHFNGCEKPYTAVTKDGKLAVINLCEQRLNPALWRHSIDPELYLVMFNVSRALGLPTTRSGDYYSSYTANDNDLRREFTGKNDITVAFRFSKREKRALRLKLCVGYDDY